MVGGRSSDDLDLPSSERGSYLLPIRRAVRDVEDLDVGDVPP